MHICRQAVNVLLRQFEVEHLTVLDNTRVSDRFGQRNEALKKTNVSIITERMAVCAS